MKVGLLVWFLSTLILAAWTLASDSLYTPGENRRNGILRRLGVPPDRPRALETRDTAILSWFDDEDDIKAAEHFASKGYIGVHKDTLSGPLLGYLDCHRLVSSKHDATLYAFMVSGPVMEIRVVGSHERMAVATGPAGSDLHLHSKNFHIPRHTQYSSIPGAGPNHDKAQAYLFETNVFNYVPDGREVLVQWVNTNGEFVDTEIALINNHIYYTGDIREFRSNIKSEVNHVAYRWYPVEASN